MNNDILETKINEIKKKKKSNKNICKKKLFSREILSLTWHVISMLEKPLTEYSYNWNFYLREMFNISIFFHKQMEFNVLKRLLLINKPTYQNSVRGFHSIPGTDCVGGCCYLQMLAFSTKIWLIPYLRKKFQNYFLWRFYFFCSVINVKFVFMK